MDILGRKPDSPDAALQVTAGLAMMAAAMMFVPIMDAIAKYLSARIPPVEIALARFVLPVLVLAPFLALRGGLLARLRHDWWAQALRGAGIAGATLFFFSALEHMPMADTAAIFFVEPLILTLFSALFLGESIGWRRILAVIVGFGGAMLIVRPSFADVGIVALLPIGAAVCFAGYMTLTKLIATRNDPWTLQFTAGIAGSLALVAVMLSGVLPEAPFVMPRRDEALMLFALALIAILGHTLIILAMRRVAAASLAPFQYLEIIGATLWGYLFFADFPDAITWAGVAIVVGSGIFVFHRERKSGGAAS